MLVKYYNNPELAYTNRKRYNNIPFEPFYQEEQKSILLGDGAQTSIKTSRNNICNYIIIDDTRWYVTSYIYMNGGQVELFLQRDVIGEFGIEGCYGKIERGYTESIIKNRKELQLNQILKDRKKIIPDFNTYGNYSVNNHNNEMWGILYLVKPTGIDPTTGELYKDKININIPAFAPQVVDYDFIENGTKTIGNIVSDVYISFNVAVTSNRTAPSLGGETIVFSVFININIGFDKQPLNINVDINRVNEKADFGIYYFRNNVTTNSPYLYEEDLKSMLYISMNDVTNSFLNSGKNSFNFPDVKQTENIIENYDNVIIKKDDIFYKYSVDEGNSYIYGEISNDKNLLFQDYFVESINNKSIFYDYSYTSIISGIDINNIVYNSRIIASNKIYNCTILTEEESGTFQIDLTRNLIDEPYTILVCPLYDVEITGTENYSIEKNNAFMIFNTIIQYLSGGENPYLVDAQIYPYCPVLTGKSTEILGYPFFAINSSSYRHSCSVQLLPSSDVKKEYIQREYSIISPEQSGKFTFNFYDYVNRIQDSNGINYATLNIIIKTALKPFSIISSAVINPDIDSLVGITYYSDLRGSQPTSNGFECSLSSNAFQTYKRQNSTYQQIFALQKEQLKKQHNVELANDITGTVINTAAAASMGAIAGSAAADAGLLGNLFGTKVAGGVAGGIASGAVVGGAMIAQTVVNDKLREYERYVQQQEFDLNIQAIQNLPNTINRISSFNEIILQDFWYIIEIYECSEYEKTIVNNFINKYGYSIGVFDFVSNYYRNGWFLRSTLVSSNYPVNLHNIAEKELMGGIYIYE